MKRAYLYQNGRYIDLNSKVTTIGSEDCDVLINGTGAEKQHAVIEYNAEQGAFWLKDLNTAFGTTVNGSLIRDAQIQLQSRDEIAFGLSDPIVFLSSSDRTNVRPWMQPATSTVLHRNNASTLVEHRHAVGASGLPQIGKPAGQHGSFLPEAERRRPLLVNDLDLRRTSPNVLRLRSNGTLGKSSSFDRGTVVLTNQRLKAAFNGWTDYGSPASSDSFDRSWYSDGAARPNRHQHRTLRFPPSNVIQQLQTRISQLEEQLRSRVRENESGLAVAYDAVSHQPQQTATVDPSKDRMVQEIITLRDQLMERNTELEQLKDEVGQLENHLHEVDRDQLEHQYASLQNQLEQSERAKAELEVALSKTERDLDDRNKTIMELVQTKQKDSTNNHDDGIFQDVELNDALGEIDADIRILEASANSVAGLLASVPTTGHETSSDLPLDFTRNHHHSDHIDDFAISSPERQILINELEQEMQKKLSDSHRRVNVHWSSSSIGSSPHKAVADHLNDSNQSSTFGDLSLLNGSSALTASASAAARNAMTKQLEIAENRFYNHTMKEIELKSQLDKLSQENRSLTQENSKLQLKAKISEIANRVFANNDQHRLGSSDKTGSPIKEPKDWAKYHSFVIKSRLLSDLDANPILKKMITIDSAVSPKTLERRINDYIRKEVSNYEKLKLPSSPAIQQEIAGPLTSESASNAAATGENVPAVQPVEIITVWATELKQKLKAEGGPSPVLFANFNEKLTDRLYHLKDDQKQSLGQLPAALNELLSMLTTCFTNMERQIKSCLSKDQLSAFKEGNFVHLAGTKLIQLYNESQSKLQEAKQEVEEYKALAAAATQSVENEKSDLQTKCSEHESAIATLNDELSRCQRDVEIYKYNAQLNQEAVDEHQSLQQRHEDLQARHAFKVNDYKLLEARSKELEAKIEQLETEQEESQKKIADLGADLEKARKTSQLSHISYSSEDSMQEELNLLRQRLAVMNGDAAAPAIVNGRSDTKRSVPFEAATAKANGHPTDRNLEQEKQQLEQEIFNLQERICELEQIVAAGQYQAEAEEVPSTIAYGDRSRVKELERKLKEQEENFQMMNEKYMNSIQELESSRLQLSSRDFLNSSTHPVQLSGASGLPESQRREIEDIQQALNQGEQSYWEFSQKLASLLDVDLKRSTIHQRPVTVGGPASLLISSSPRPATITALSQPDEKLTAAEEIASRIEELIKRVREQNEELMTHRQQAATSSEDPCNAGSNTQRLRRFLDSAPGSMKSAKDRRGRSGSADYHSANGHIGDSERGSNKETNSARSRKSPLQRKQLPLKIVQFELSSQRPTQHFTSNRK